MEEQKNTEKTVDKKGAAAKRRNVLKKLDLESARLLAQLKERANKKSHGRKIRDSEIIGKALSLIEPQHLQGLQDATLSEKDRLHMAHEDYMKANGKISLDQFIGKLLKGELRL